MASRTGSRSGEDAPLLGRRLSSTSDHPSSPSDARAAAAAADPQQSPNPKIPHGFRLDSRIRSAGVTRISAASARLSTAERVLLFVSIFLVGYAYGLESQVRSAYQPYATASFHVHSYLATINVIRSVVAVAVQPTAAKIADVFGRFEVVATCTVIYTVGIVLEAAAGTVEVFCVGAVVYQIGYTCIVLLMEVLIADFSSMRARVFFSYIPALPFLINTWISGDITAAVLEATTWRWGIGMWAIIYPVASLPLLGMLFFIERRAAAEEDDEDDSSDDGTEANNQKYSRESIRNLMVALSHQIDVVGLLAVVISLSLILAPLTITGRDVGHWKDPHIIVPLIVGVLLFPAFVLWERRYARNPLVPFHLLRDRGVWAALAVRSLLNFAWYTQGNYLYTVLFVVGFPTESATRVLSFFSFFGVVSGVITGAVIYKLRKLKSIIVAGTCIFMVAFALLIRLPGGSDNTSQNGLMASQVLMGLAGGFFAYPTQASIQASASREHVAVLTGLYLSFYNVGSALGTCLSGAIWTQILLPTLKSNLSFQPDDDLAELIYDSPFDVLAEHPIGTDIRTAIIQSYAHIQRLLAISGICLCVPMIAFAIALRNPKLSENQVQPEAESEDADGHADQRRRSASSTRPENI